MRGSAVQLLRCPRCQRGGLRPTADTEEIVFGPLTCAQCQATYPVGEGVVDFTSERDQRAGFQRKLERRWVARSYERYLRPIMKTALARRRIDRDSELSIYKSLLSPLKGPILDLACGTGLFARRLALEPPHPTVVAMDVSKPMIEEGVAQAREAGARIDWVLAEGPTLPFADASFDAVLHADAMHWFNDLGLALSEISRVLKPSGRYVATTFLPSRLPTSLVYRGAGLFTRPEAEWRRQMAINGMTGFERIRVSRLIFIKGTKGEAGPSR